MLNGATRTVNDTDAIRVDATETAVNPEYRCGATTIHGASAAWFVSSAEWVLAATTPCGRHADQANADYVTNICEVDVSRMDQTRRDPFRVRRFLQAVARNVATEASITTLVADVDEPGALARSTA
jgi:hypothetical protein